jgi:DNA-binding FadR family transcriptional regulator
MNRFTHQTNQPLRVITPVRQVRLYDQVVNGLLDLLRDGSLQPGMRLPAERELAAMFAVSRASLRQALTAVEVSGYIQVRPGSGTYVLAIPESVPEEASGDPFGRPAVTEAAPLEILESRLLVEPGIARLAAQRRTQDDLSAMADLVVRMADDVRAGRNAWAADWGFHTRLGMATQNSSIQRLTAEFQEQMSHPVWELLRARNLGRGEHARKYSHDHDEILVAVRDRDPDEAERLMAEHIDHVMRDLDDEGEEDTLGD